ncbi:hypothetical protein O181_095137 [Austropuccinia psidii MF-1]|uniref:Reverse transcriptase domain-containing protein n=1 Tax=Austropuccinia psidii MF-1 TaxID=1389203 RepID=A0A9Q3J4S1_9BASI|nr:hypothetical protein [Austropuccinia psidii MF-1]
MDLGVLRKVGHNEQVNVRTPVIIALHNGKLRMVGDLRALSTYNIPDRSPIPIIHGTLTQLSQAKFITAMDSLKGFHQNSKKLLRIIVHCGIYEYLRMPFGIKNAPSHYQRLINAIFSDELSEGWLIIYIDDIIVCSETLENNLKRLERVLQKIVQVNMKVSFKYCHFAYSELKALRHLLLIKDFKDASLPTKLDELWKKAYEEGRVHLLDGIILDRTKHECVITLTDRSLIQNILHECHYSVVSGHLSEYRTLERVKTCSWWPNCRKGVAEYCLTCDRCQKENRDTSNKFQMMIQIQEPKSPWEITHMDWVTALPPGGDSSFN